MSEFTYPDVGAIRDGHLPPGYRHGHVRERIGRGRAAFQTAAEGLMRWEVHRRSGLRVRASAERAAEGVDVVSSLGVGPLRLVIPARVVWTIDEADRKGFAYGTLNGHPFSGEELLAVEIDEHEDVWFVITVFSRPRAWYARIAGPVAGWGQAISRKSYVRAGRRLAGAA